MASKGPKRINSWEYDPHRLQIPVANTAASIRQYLQRLPVSSRAGHASLNALLDTFEQDPNFIMPSRATIDRSTQVEKVDLLCSCFRTANSRIDDRTWIVSTDRHNVVLDDELLAIIRDNKSKVNTKKNNLNNALFKLPGWRLEELADQFHCGWEYKGLSQSFGMMSDKEHLRGELFDFIWESKNATNKYHIDFISANAEFDSLEPLHGNKAKARRAQRRPTPMAPRQTYANDDVKPQSRPVSALKFSPPSKRHLCLCGKRNNSSMVQGQKQTFGKTKEIGQAWLALVYGSEDRLAKTKAAAKLKSTYGLEDEKTYEYIMAVYIFDQFFTYMLEAKHLGILLVLHTIF
ncbi:hypothetical protein HDU79_000223 [Rhizoclosmatium sp. JEL0117]|nr:hypothetical protein HDU79_000223 [Rhizoclosmatium sp. JEL0117]